VHFLDWRVERERSTEWMQLSPQGARSVARVAGTYRPPLGRNEPFDGIVVMSFEARIVRPTFRKDGTQSERDERTTHAAHSTLRAMFRGGCVLAHDANDAKQRGTALIWAF